MERRTSRLSTCRKRMDIEKYPDLSRIAHALSLVPYKASITRLVKRVQSLRKARREHVLAICERALKNERIGLRESDMIRVVFAQVIVAASPHSVPLMEKLLRKKLGRNDYEIHFTLFCCFGWMPNAKELCSSMLFSVREYLLSVKQDTARAAWMAGDLLGDHWPLRKTLPILMQVAKQARYVTGRAAAVDGLEHALTNKGLTRAQRNNIFSLLQDIAKSDRSAQLKKQVMLILGDKGKKQKETISLLKHITKNDKSNSVRQMAEYILEERIQKALPKSKA